MCIFCGTILKSNPRRNILTLLATKDDPAHFSALQTGRTTTNLLTSQLSTCFATFVWTLSKYQVKVQPSLQPRPPTHSPNSQMMVTHAHVCPCNCYLKQATLSYKLFKHIIKPHGKQPQKPASLTYTLLDIHKHPDRSLYKYSDTCCPHTHVPLYQHKHTAWALCFDSVVITSGEVETVQSMTASEPQTCLLYTESTHMELIPTSYCNSSSPNADYQKIQLPRVRATLYITFQRFAEARQPLAASDSEEELWKPCVRFHRTQLDFRLGAVQICVSSYVVKRYVMGRKTDQNF